MRKRTVFSLAIFTLILFSCNNNGTDTKTTADTAASQKEVSELEKKVTEQPQSDSLRESLVQELVQNNQLDKAIGQIDLLLQKNPGSPAYLFMKADALEKKGDTTNAISFYRQSLDTAGLFPEAQLRLAALYAEKGNAASTNLCDELLKEPTAIRMRSDILFVKAAYYSKIKDSKNALKIYNQLIKEDYTYLDAYIEKGLVYYDMGNFAEALKTFEQTTSISNKYADGYFWMAKTEEKLNHTQEAIDNYKRALALDQSITEAKDALKRLGVVK